MTGLVVVNLLFRIAVTLPQGVEPTPVSAPLVSEHRVTKEVAKLTVRQTPEPLKPASLVPPVLTPAPTPGPAFVPTPAVISSLGPAVESCSRCTAAVVRSALDQLGAKYIHGAADPSRGFDCAGLVVYAFQQGCGKVSIPRGSKAQFEYGERVAKRDLRPGDLVFFHFPRVGWHVGIYLGNNEFIHAPNHKRTVSVDSLLARAYTVTYMGARRVLPGEGGGLQSCNTQPEEKLAKTIHVPPAALGLPAASLALP